jgi:hypothetical protein
MKIRRLAMGSPHTGFASESRGRREKGKLKMGNGGKGQEGIAGNVNDRTLENHKG